MYTLSIECARQKNLNMRSATVLRLIAYIPTYIEYTVYDTISATKMFDVLGTEFDLLVAYVQMFPAPLPTRAGKLF